MFYIDVIFQLDFFRSIDIFWVMKFQFFFLVVRERSMDMFKGIWLGRFRVVEVLEVESRIIGVEV